MKTQSKQSQIEKMIGNSRILVNHLLERKLISAAIDMVRKLAHDHAVPETQQYLRETYLRVIRFHLNRSGGAKDARNMLQQAESIPFEASEWWEELALLRVKLGDLSRAEQLLSKVPESQLRARLPLFLVDKVVSEPGDQSLLKGLSPELQAQVLNVRHAFDLYQQGKTDEAKAQLQSIGLSSPLLEWKLLLRGLIAWSAREDDKAIENFSRLSPDRLPYRIAMPFRFGIDKSFAVTHNPAQTMALSKLSASIFPRNEKLEKLRAELMSQKPLASAISQASLVVNDLKNSFPHLIPKLRDLMYWSFMDNSKSSPYDFLKYVDIFGPHPNDPDGNRLDALKLETMNELDQAEKAWERYIKDMEDFSWGPGEYEIAQALIHERLGDWMQEYIPYDWDDEVDESMLSDSDIKAIEHYRKAIQLMPERVGPYCSMMKLMIENANFQQGLQEVELATQRFPTHPQAMALASTVYECLDNLEEARRCLKLAFDANPLDRPLQERYGEMLIREVRSLILEKQYEQAQEKHTEMLRFVVAELYPVAGAIGAVLAHLRKDTDALNATLEQIDRRTRPEVRDYLIHVEGTRLKAKKKWLEPYSDRLEQFWNTPPSLEIAKSMLQVVNYYDRDLPRYRGFTKHQKQLFGFFERFFLSGKEEQIIQAGYALRSCNQYKQLGKMLVHMNLLQSGNPYFLFIKAEAMLFRKRYQSRLDYMTTTLFRAVWKFLKEHPEDRYADLQQMFEERVENSPILLTYIHDYFN